MPQVLRLLVILALVSWSSLASAADTPAAPPVVSPPSEKAASTSVGGAIPEETQQAIARLASEIEQAAQSVERNRHREDELLRQRTALDKLQTEAMDAIGLLSPRLDALKVQVDRLGPPPADDAPPEAAALAAERARLAALSSEIGAAVKQLNLAQVRARQLVSYVQTLRQENFTRDVMRRTTSPLKPSAWREVGHEVQVALREVGDILAAWWSHVRPRLTELLLSLALSLAIYIGLTRLVGRLIETRLQPPVCEQPSFFARAGAASLVAPALALPGIAAASALFFSLDALGLLGAQFGRIAESAFSGYLLYVVVSALARASFEPDRPFWRMYDLSDRTARRLVRLMQATAAVFALQVIVRDLIAQLYLTLPVSIASTFLGSSAIAALLIAIVCTPFERATPSATPVHRLRPWLLKVPLLILALSVLGVSALGYVSLGRFIAGQVLLTGSLLLLLSLLHLAIRALTDPSEGGARLDRLMETDIGLKPERRHQVLTAIAVLLNISLAILALPLVLLTWGFSLPDFLGFLKALFFGFEIGQFRISLARILFAVGLFAALVFLTRMFQRWLGSNVLPAAKLEPGIANSLQIGLGYAGFAIAALAALSYAGLDITNLAIVAGALSVGIGFGLQSIVNNFVSGLILLVERPIKVGDWIVVRDREGLVRRISVRATEIETFDRATLIVPNSELITSTVVNWTHRNSVARVVIRIGVSYSADPALVIETLQRVAQQSPAVLSHPAPTVAFDNFGSSSLDFSVRVYLADCMQSSTVQTELRLAIHKALKEAGIEVPYPQHDIHLRDLDRLKTVLAGLNRGRQPDAEVKG